MIGAGIGGVAGGGRGKGAVFDEDRPLELKLIYRLLGYTRPYARLRNALIGLVIARSIQLPLLAWSLSAVIAGPIAGRDPGNLAWGVLGFSALAVITDLMFHYRQRYALELGEAVVHDLRQEIFAKILSMPMSYFTRTKVGHVISRSVSDIEALRGGVQDVLFVSIVQFGQGIIAAILMAIIDPLLFSLLLAMTPILWAINYYFRRRISRATRQVQESFSRVTATIAEAVGGIRVTQGFARESDNAGIFRRLIFDHSRTNMNMARASAPYVPLLDLNTQMFTALLLLVGGYRVLHPEIQVPVGDLIQFLFLANMAFGPIQSIGTQYNKALVAMAGAERVFELLDAKPDWEDAPDAKPLLISRGRVEFHDVTFGYDSKRPVVQGINFVAEPGTSTALVGATGSGKTTLLALLSKFYLPQAGRVTIDGADLAGITSQSLHHQIGIVQQQNFLFSGTVLENIRYAKPGASEKEVRAALDDLGCLDMVQDLPQGLATEVGERGAGLSMGQRQVICFARAMIANPRILLLDEATSSVDALTEFRLQTALALLMHGRTTLVIAHRLSTIRRADLVLVLAHGRIEERGSHAQLLEAGGAYARLYRQFAQVHPDPARE
jgi:ATP-binding cassette subfamily B protein